MPGIPAGLLPRAFCAAAPVVSRGRRGVVTLGDQALLFAAAVRGAFQRPFYAAEFLEQCRFIHDGDARRRHGTSPVCGAARRR
jgi:hypothetical protein